MDLFDEHVEKYGIDIKPHVEDTLRFLKEHGVKMALATSTARTRAQQRLDSVGIADTSMKRYAETRSPTESRSLIYI